MTNLNFHPLLSLDLGNAYTGVRTGEGYASFRSIAGRLSKSRRFGEINSPLAFTFEGETLVFGDDTRDLIDGQPIAHTALSRYTDGFYRKLFAAALWLAFQQYADQGAFYPVIVNSIPVSEYADGRGDGVKELLCGEYCIAGLDDKLLRVTVTPENLIIIPEGTGTFFSGLYAPGSKLATREVAVLDVGYYTTDLTVFNKGNYVTGSARSVQHGVRQVAEAVHRFLRQEYGFEGDVWQVDAVLAEGCIQIGNRCESFVDERENAFADLTDDILAFYRSSKGNRTPGVVILSGGGAPDVYKTLPDELRLKGWITSAHPRRANVEGAYQFLEQREAAQQS